MKRLIETYKQKLLKWSCAHLTIEIFNGRIGHISMDMSTPVRPFEVVRGLRK